jgi:hypothetical protein
MVSIVPGWGLCERDESRGRVAMGLLELLAILIAIILVATMWWIPESMRRQRVQSGIDRAKEKIAELELRIERGSYTPDYPNEEFCRSWIATLQRKIDELDASL